MPGNYPFVGNAQTFLNDFAINNPNPAVEYGGTEANALYYEDREIAGAMYRVQNATYNKVAGQWVAINSSLPCYGTVLIANGTTQFISQTAGTTPFTSWNTVASIDKNGNATIGTVMPSGLSVPATTDFSGVKVYNVKYYGAKGDNVTDDTVAIGNAISAATANGQAAVVYFPAGNYVTNASSAYSLSNGFIQIIGAGPGITKIYKNNKTADLFNVSSQKCTFRDFTIDSQVTGHTGGAGIGFVAGALQCRVQNVEIANIYDGIVLNGSNVGNIWVVDTLLSGCVDRHFWARNCAGSIFVAQTQINGAGTTSIGVELNIGSGFNFSDVAVFTPGAVGFNVVSTAGNFVEDIFCWGVACDSNGSVADGWHFDGTNAGSTVRNVSLVNCWSGTNSGNGFYFKNSETFKLTGCWAINNGRHGFILDVGCQDFTLLDPLASANSSSFAVTNTYDGIHIVAGVSLWRIFGGRSGPVHSGFQQTPQPSITASDFQRWGLFVEAGASNNYEIVSLDCTGNLTGRLQDNGTGSAKRIAFNRGYNPVGPLTGGAAPPIPASTSAATNTYGVDATVYVAGGTLTQIAVNGSNTNLTSGTFRIPAGETLTLTYSVAPTTYLWVLD